MAKERFDLPDVVPDLAVLVGAGGVVAGAEVGEPGLGAGQQVPDDECATRRPVVSPVQPGGIGGRSLGLMADLEPKGEGDKSMPEKQRSCSGV
jgi:hypothetical protein